MHYAGTEPLRIVNIQSAFGNKESVEWSGGQVTSGGTEGSGGRCVVSEALIAKKGSKWFGGRQAAGRVLSD